MIKLIALAIIQGLTEFLPVSSSGHLVLGKHLLGMSEPDATVEIFLHFGTLLSILVFYRRRIWELLQALFRADFRSPEGREILFILWASIPAGVIGVLFDEYIESLFSAPEFAATMLIITGGILLSTMFAQRRQLSRQLGWGNTIFIGFAQALSILPGISRSGSTISAALWSGINPRKAAEFSFLLATPALAGAIALKGAKMLKAGVSPSPQLWAAVLVAAVVGYFALALLIPIIRRGKMWIFGIYCLILGGVSLILI
ncbi:undecaprenyl-diphosphate phosphatase [bacterium]|nr:undecaprenyl-diphosphate phosphatase [bacterium]